MKIKEDIFTLKMAILVSFVLIFIISSNLHIHTSSKLDVIEINSTHNYSIEYNTGVDGFKLHIKNPCVILVDGTGVSMRPYWNEHTLTLIDKCFPPEKLQIGDVIIFVPQYANFSVHHRIIDIDYNKQWVRTQGDNRKTNPTPDDFVSFDLILGKDIGILNII